jgi:hypothetical protein
LPVANKERGITICVLPRDRLSPAVSVRALLRDVIGLLARLNLRLCLRNLSLKYRLLHLLCASLSIEVLGSSESTTAVSFSTSRTDQATLENRCCDCQQL